MTTLREKNCRKTKGVFPWSPTLIHTGNQMIAINALIRKDTSQVTLSVSMEKFITSNQPLWLSKPMSELVVIKRTINKRLSYIKQNAQQFRDEFISNLVEYYYPSSPNKKLIISNLIRKEESKACFRQIKCALNTIYKLPFVNLLIGNEEDTILIDNPIEIATNMLNKYCSVIDTPYFPLPKNKSFLEDFGLFGEGNLVNNLLTGKYPITNGNYSLIEQQLLQACKRTLPTPDNVRDTVVTPEEFCQTFNKIREDTTTIPCLPHMSHYKVAYLYETLVYLYSLRMSVPLKGRFSPIRWQSSVHIILEKIPGFPHVDLLRSIQLLDPEYNSLLKMKIIHQTMHIPQPQLMLGEDMYGGRHKIASHYALMSQTLTYDIHSQMRLAGSLINIDARKFFDKIYPNFANIELQRLNIHPSIAKVFSETSLKMKHQISTSQGVMPPQIQAKDNDVFSGVGKGNEVSGISWLAMESIILKALEIFCSPGEFLHDPTNQFKNWSQVIAFVDDNNLISSYPHKNYSTIFKDIIKKFTYWQDALQGTVGIINQEKMSVYSWKWSIINGKLKARNIPIEHHITDETIIIKSVLQLYTFLGILTTPFNCNHGQYEKLRDQDLQLSARIQTSSFNRDEILQWYHTSWIPILSYSAPICCFSDNQFDNINSPIMHTILPKIHINLHFPGLHFIVHLHMVEWVLCLL